MFERFTERAQQVITFAQEAVKENGASHITTGYLLLGLLREEEELGAKALRDFGIKEDKIVCLLSRGTKEYLGGEAIPFSITAKKALENALREALSLGHNYIGTEHLLLSLIRMPQDLADEKLSAWGILNELEINENEIRQYIISGLSATSKIASERYIKWAIEIIRISEELLILEREIKRDGFSGNSFDEARTHLNNIKKFLTTRIGESILSDHK